MGQKPTGPAQGTALRYIAVIDEARQLAGMTKADLIKKSGMSANSFHTKMRGERPFNTNDIDQLASALEADLLLTLILKSGQRVSSDSVTPIEPYIARAIDFPIPLAEVAKKGSRDRGGDDGQG